MASPAPEGTIPIPEPKGLPFLGNALDIDTEFPLGSMLNFADQFGTVFISLLEWSCHAKPHSPLEPKVSDG